jgi:CheY-like chemotaxis protein
MHRLVLADDSKTIQKVVQLSFAGEKFEIHCFENGTSALEFVCGRGADVVLADVSLPMLDGYELCREIKHDPRTDQIPVILLSGTLDPLDLNRAEQACYDGNLSKPFETLELVRMVKDLLSHDETGELEEVTVDFPSSPEPVKSQVEPLFHIPIPARSGELVFQLTREQCLASPAVPSRELVGQIRKEVFHISGDQLSLVVEQVMERLPRAILKLVPEITRELLTAANSTNTRESKRI